MKLKSFLIGTVLAAASMSSYAAGDSQALGFSLSGNSVIGYSTAFGVTHLTAGSFTDVLTFSPSVGPSLLDGWLQTMNLSGGHNIDFISASLNGNALTFTPTGAIETGTLDPVWVSGPLVLTVSGISNSVTASYSGGLNVTPVPEPETYIMMLGGLGILSFIGRRRKKADA